MEEERSKVTQWLEDKDDDAVSVVSGFHRRDPSEFGDFDDSQYYLVDPKSGEEEEATVTPSYAVEEALGEVAAAAQRVAVCNLHRDYSKGRMHDHPDYARHDLRRQQFFRLEGFMQLATIDEPQLYEALKAGPVRTRLSAETGLGKTRKLAGAIAAKCGLRVCQLELNTHVSNDALKVQKATYSIPGSARAWCREKKAYLTSMTYAEFRGIVLSGGRDRLFEDFDVFYFDEAHEPLAKVWVATQYFACYAKPHNSLIVTSATVSTQESNNVIAKNVGRFEVEQGIVTVEEAMDKGLLVGKHLKDRSMMICACDEEVALLRAYYLEMGIDVRVLDSASTAADYQSVFDAFTPATSVVPRVLVTISDYGTSYNIPVAYVMTTATLRVYEMAGDNTLQAKRIPLMQRTVTQHQGRTARGLATGSGGWVMRGDRAPPKDLLVSEALEAYLSLVAAHIQPRPGLFDSVSKVLPKGIDAGVARLILRTTLPPALAVRYLGSDGRVAAKYVAGLKLFSQPGEAMRPSKDKLPVGYDTWVSEVVGNYYEGDTSATKESLQVPFASPEGLKVVMHAISAVADGLIQMDYWDWYDEDDESDDEVTGVRTKAKRRVVKPRVPERVVQQPTVSVESSRREWVYDADPAKAAKQQRRRAMSWTANGDGRVAVTTLLRAIEQNDLGVSKVFPQEGVPEHEGKFVYTLPVEDDAVDIKSAGGGRILAVPAMTHACFMSGTRLEADAVAEVLEDLRNSKALMRFAKATVFDNWSPAWLCWFNTFADKNVMAYLMTAGYHSQAYKLLGYLYDRFRSEVLSVAASSNLYSSKLRGFFSKKPSISKFADAARKGKLPIAQTDRFVARVLRIKDAYDSALLACEVAGVFDPGQVTSAQRRLPLRDKNRGMPVIDEEVVGAPLYTTREHGMTSW